MLILPESPNKIILKLSGVSYKAELCAIIFIKVY